MINKDAASVRFVSEAFKPELNLMSNEGGEPYSIDINVKHGILDLDTSNLTSPSPKKSMQGGGIHTERVLNTQSHSILPVGS